MTTHCDNAWTGLALVVGTGGIGSAITARLKQQCPGLRVITAGRLDPPSKRCPSTLNVTLILRR